MFILIYVTHTHITEQFCSSHTLQEVYIELFGECTLSLASQTQPTPAWITLSITHGEGSHCILVRLSIQWREWSSELLTLLWTSPLLTLHPLWTSFSHSPPLNVLPSHTPTPCEHPPFSHSHPPLNIPSHTPTSFRPDWWRLEDSSAARSRWCGPWTEGPSCLCHQTQDTLVSEPDPSEGLVPRLKIPKSICKNYELM